MLSLTHACSGSRVSRSTLVLCIGVAVLAYSGCARSPQSKRDRYIAAGKKLLEKKDYESALLEFKNATQVMPKDAESHYQMGLASLGMGDFNRAVVLLRKAIELEPKHIGARVRLAALMSTSRETEDVDKARNDLEQVLAISPNDLEALNALAAAELKLGGSASAEAHLKKAIELFPHNIQAGIALAKLRMLRSDWLGAEEALKNVVVRNPKMSDAEVPLAEYYVSRNIPQAAEQAYRQALNLEPKDVAALTGLAGLQVRAGKLDVAEKLYKELSVLPSSENVLYGDFLQQHGKRDLAILEFQRLWKAYSDDRAIRARLLAAYLAAGKETEAWQLLEKALKKNPKDTDALLIRGRLELSQSKGTEAQADANAVLQYAPDSAEAHKILAEVYRTRREALLEQRELAEVVRLKPSDLPARLSLAQLLRESKAYKTALDLMSQAPSEQAQTLPWIIERNWILVDSGDQAELARGVAEGLKLRRVPDLILQLGTLNYQKHNYPAAREAAEELLKMNPTDTVALDLVARTYVVEKQSAVALKRVQDAVTKQPSSARLQQFLGRFLLFMKKPGEARQAFLAAQRLDSKSLAPIVALAEMDLQDRHFDRVRTTLAPLVANGRADIDTKMVLAEAELGAGNDARALELYRKVADEQPRNAKALNNTAYMLVDRAHQPDEALKYAQLAVELAPGSPAEEHTLGWVLYSKGLYQTALPHLQTAATKDPKAEHLYHLAAVQFRTGDIERGRQALAEAMKINPRAPEAAVAKSALEESQK